MQRNYEIFLDISIGLFIISGGLSIVNNGFSESQWTEDGGISKGLPVDNTWFSGVLWLRDYRISRSLSIGDTGTSRGLSIRDSGISMGSFNQRSFNVNVLLGNILKGNLWFPKKFFETAFHVLLHILNPLIDIYICTLHSEHMKRSIVFNGAYVSAGYALVKTSFKIIASKWDHGFWREIPWKN